MDIWGRKNDLANARVVYAILGTASGMAVLGTALKTRSSKQARHKEPEKVESSIKYIFCRPGDERGNNVLDLFETEDPKIAKKVIKRFETSELERRGREKALQQQLAAASPWPNGQGAASNEQQDTGWADAMFSTEGHSLKT